MARTSDRGSPASYYTLSAGTSVYSSDGIRLGEISRVLADLDSDIFDGIVVASKSDERFVPATRVQDIYERLVVLSVTANEARRLPEPPPVPAVVKVVRDEFVDQRPPVPRTGPIRRVWRRIRGGHRRAK
jgi:hypothetical protein